MTNDIQFRTRFIDDLDLEPEPPTPLSICTPMYNSMPFINRYLHHLTTLDYPQDLISLYFTVQGNDKTLDVMKYFRDQFSDAYRKIKVKKMKMLQGGDLPHVRNVVMCRNNLIQWSRPDPILFIDHDNFPPRPSIHRLRITARHGGDISAGIYVFYQTDKLDTQRRRRVGFTCFFIFDGLYYYASLDQHGPIGSFSADILGRRVFCEAVSMGTTLIQRNVLDDIKFTVPWGTEQTDDTTFCLEAGKHGYKCIADFGLLVPHWGFNEEILKIENGRAYLKIGVSREMEARRDKMLRDGVYVAD